MSDSSAVFVVHDEFLGKESVWSRKPYAMAEVQALKNVIHDGDKSVVGSEVWFMQDLAILHDEKPDSISLVYGENWQNGKEFKEAQESIDQIREARVKSLKHFGNR